MTRELEKFELTLQQLEEKEAEETLKLQQKYNSLRQPILKSRGRFMKHIPNFWMKVVCTIGALCFLRCMRATLLPA